MMGSASDVFSVLSILSCVIISASSNKLARGFNEKIDWVTLEDGLKLSKEQNKPLMLLIHKTWCGACKGLKPTFAASKEIEELSKQFVMVNTEDDEEPKDKAYTPDGGYIPRIVFLDPSGKVKPEIINEGGHQKYKYFYADADSIVSSMKRMLGSGESTEDRKASDEL